MMYHQPLISTFILFSICINISHSSLLPHGSNKRVGSSTPTFIRGGSTKALDKDAISQLDRQRHQKPADGLIQDDENKDISCNNNDDDDDNLKASDQEDIATDNNDGEDTDTQLYVTKRDGRMELLDKNKVCFICIGHEPYTKLCASFNSHLFFISLPLSLAHFSLNINTTPTKIDIKTSTKSINKLKHKVSKPTPPNISNICRIISKHYNLPN